MKQVAQERLTKGAENPGDFEIVVPGDGDKTSTELGKSLQIQNLRIGQVSNEGRKITVFFDPPEIGKYYFNLAKGEHGNSYFTQGNKKGVK